MFLGIDDNAGLVYESAGSAPDRPVLPIPTVSRAKIIDAASDWNLLGSGFRVDAHAWLFREDSFDAVTRTRRGRLYQSMTGAAYPNHQSRVMPLPFEQFARGDVGADGKLNRPLNVYAAATTLLERDKSRTWRDARVGNEHSCLSLAHRGRGDHGVGRRYFDS